MSIKKVTEKQKSTFNKRAVHPLQTWEWGEFRKETGNEIVRLQVKSGKVTDSLQVVITKIPRTGLGIGTVLRGPMPTKEIVSELLKVAEEKNLVFIKLEPDYVIKKNKIACADETKVIEILKSVGGVPGKTLFTPTSFWIDLTKDEEELMKGFKSKTRYNVRYAKRKGVKVSEDNSDKAFEKYLELTRETVERQGFYAHSEKYHRLMWKHLHTLPTTHNSQPIARLLVAKYKGEVLVTWVVFVWKNFLYYPYGASSTKHQNRQPSSLMMWEAIRYGKKLGLKTFDLWGREPGEGFTRFKKGFNPQVVEFLGTWDLKTSPLYWPYRAAESLRWAFLKTKSKFTKPKF